MLGKAPGFRKGIGSHTHPNKGSSNDWLTPPELLKDLGEFDLDPCASLGQPWKTAKKHYTVIGDGLSQPWAGRIWCNPPYGKETQIWLAKLKAHGNGIALIFARTETDLFSSHAWDGADAILFLQGRLYFRLPVTGKKGKYNSGGPSALIAYGSNNVEALRKSRLKGALVTKWENLK